jgi:hypothetical protein
MNLKDKGQAEETALALASLLLLEAVGLELAHSQTLGAVIALFAAALIACVLRCMASDPK